MHSGLTDLVYLSPNFSEGRTQEIDTITIHCFVAQVSAKRIGEVFSNKNKNASCNYGIAFDGKIVDVVEEENRSWCTGGRKYVGKDKNGKPIYKPIYVNGISGSMNDQRAITIEVASDATHPYKITKEAYDSLIRLLVDICERYPKINRLKWKGDKQYVGKPEIQNMTVHRWFAQKACPGDYIYERLGQIANEVNKILDEKENNKNKEKKEEEVIMTKEKVYNKIEEIPEYYKEVVGDYIKRGIVKGYGEGNLGLSEDMCRMLVILHRLESEKGGNKQ